MCGHFPKRYVYLHNPGTFIMVDAVRCNLKNNSTDIITIRYFAHLKAIIKGLLIKGNISYLKLAYRDILTFPPVCYLSLSDVDLRH